MVHLKNRVLIKSNINTVTMVLYCMVHTPNIPKLYLDIINHLICFQMSSVALEVITVNYLNKQNIPSDQLHYLFLFFPYQHLACPSVN